MKTSEQDFKNLSFSFIFFFGGYILKLFSFFGFGKNLFFSFS